MKTRILIVSIYIFFTTSVTAQTKTEALKTHPGNSVEIIRYSIPNDQHANFEKAYDEACEYLKKSKYCLSFEVLHGDEEPDHYMVVINWTSKEEHLNGFRKSVEFVPFFTLVKPFYNNIDEMKHYYSTKTSSNKAEHE